MTAKGARTRNMQNLFTDSFFRKQKKTLKSELRFDNETLKTCREIVLRRIDYVKNFDPGDDSEEKDWPGFEKDVLRDLLGYAIKDDSPWDYNVFRQRSIRKAGRGRGTGKVDCALGFYSRRNRRNSDDHVLVEFKAPDSRDLGGATEQLWNYLEHHPKAKWGIVTNFNEITLYHHAGRKLKKQTFYFVVPEELAARKCCLHDEDELIRFLAIFRKDRLTDREGQSPTEKMLSGQGLEEKKVEKEFYGKYAGLRKELISEIAEHNPAYRKNRQELISVAQKILDRLIFIWFCEDSREELLPRGILQRVIAGRTALSPELRSENDVWEEIRRLFRAVDDGTGFNIRSGYNGELFKPDPRIDGLMIPNRIFEEKVRAIVEQYDFGHENELSLNILGHIFEQSITDLEELRAATPSEKKSGKRKREGVYYTPEYITRHIVEQAVGGWLAERRKELGRNRLPKLTEQIRRKIPGWAGKRRKTQTPRLTGKVLAELEKAIRDQGIVGKLRLLRYSYKDEAALRKALEAFPETAQWADVIVGEAMRTDPDRDTWQAYVRFWSDYREVLRKIRVLDPACGSGAFLTQAFDYLHKEGERVNRELAKLGEKKQRKVFDLDRHILENNLHGVDINPESVEITKLSLWLKTADRHKKLNSLYNNVKCGNYLIDDPQVAGEKAFRWEKEFPDIMRNSGFDVVIGNPPYVFAREKITAEEKAYYASVYCSAQYQVNTYLLFIEKTVNLLRHGAYYGLIVPNAWLGVSSAASLREFVLGSSFVSSVVSLAGCSFEGANIETVIINARKQATPNPTLKVFLGDGDEFRYSHSLNQSDFNRNRGFEFRVFSDETGTRISEKLRSESEILDNLTIIKSGLKAYEKGKGHPKQSAEDVRNRPYDHDCKFDNTTYEYLEGKNVGRYFRTCSGLYLKYGDNLAAPRTFDIFSNPRIIVREITARPPRAIISTYTEDVVLFNMSNIAILGKKNAETDLKYILALINSSLLSYYFVLNTAKSVRKLFPKIILRDLRQFPIRKISRNQQRPFIGKADEMLDLGRRLAGQKQALSDYLSVSLGLEKQGGKLQSPENLSFEELVRELEKKKVSTRDSRVSESLRGYSDKIRSLKIRSDLTDREIDNMVCRLYGLDDEEIKIVEARVRC